MRFKLHLKLVIRVIYADIRIGVVKKEKKKLVSASVMLKLHVYD